MTSWILNVEEDEQGEYIITFPPDLLEAAGWKAGDNIKWIDRGNGAWQLEKVDNETQESI